MGFVGAGLTDYLNSEKVSFIRYAAPLAQYPGEIVHNNTNTFKKMT